jgi:hypothetical protein
VLSNARPPNEREPLWEIRKFEESIVERQGITGTARSVARDVVDMKKWKKEILTTMTIRLYDLARWRPGRLEGKCDS